MFESVEIALQLSLVGEQFRQEIMEKSRGKLSCSNLHWLSTSPRPMLPKFISAASKLDLTAYYGFKNYLYEKSGYQILLSKTLLLNLIVMGSAPEKIQWAVPFRYNSSRKHRYSDNACSQQQDVPTGSHISTTDRSPGSGVWGRKRQSNCVCWEMNPCTTDYGSGLNSLMHTATRRLVLQNCSGRYCLSELKRPITSELLWYVWVTSTKSTARSEIQGWTEGKSTSL